jgi:antitoxin VapB
MNELRRLFKKPVFPSEHGTQDGCEERESAHKVDMRVQERFFDCRNKNWLGLETVDGSGTANSTRDPGQSGTWCTRLREECAQPGFELPGNDAIMRREGERLIIEPAPPKTLLAVLEKLSPIAEKFPSIPELATAPVRL